MWHLQPRLCVNLRQLMTTDTVEFRHFPGTLDLKELFLCVSWCADYLEAAINDWGIGELLQEYTKAAFPKFPEYSHWRELRYRATCHDGTLPKEVIERNIKAIEAGAFRRQREGAIMRCSKCGGQCYHPPGSSRASAYRLAKRME